MVKISRGPFRAGPLARAARRGLHPLRTWWSNLNLQERVNAWANEAVNSFTSTTVSKSRWCANGRLVEPLGDVAGAHDPKLLVEDQSGEKQAKLKVDILRFKMADPVARKDTMTPYSGKVVDLPTASSSKVVAGTMLSLGGDNGAGPALFSVSDQAVLSTRRADGGLAWQIPPTPNKEKKEENKEEKTGPKQEETDEGQKGGEEPAGEKKETDKDKDNKGKKKNAEAIATHVLDFRSHFHELPETLRIQHPLPQG